MSTSLDAMRGRLRHWRPFSFNENYAPTAAEVTWLAEVNKTVEFQLRRDWENLAIFGTTDVPEDYRT